MQPQLHTYTLEQWLPEPVEVEVGDLLPLAWVVPLEPFLARVAEILP